jgi:hypothetical protein
MKIINELEVNRILNLEKLINRRVTIIRDIINRYKSNQITKETMDKVINHLGKII